MWSSFVLFLFSEYKQVFQQNSKSNLQLDRAGGRKDWSGFFLTKSTHANVISEIYCYVLPTFCCDKSLAGYFVLFSFRYPSAHVFRIKTFLVFQDVYNFQIGVTLIFNP